MSEFQHHIRKAVIGPMEKSSFVAAIVPMGDCDVKFAVELGAAVMMNKPIIAVVRPGTVIPPKLASVVDRFVEGDPTDPSFAARLTAVIHEMVGL